MSTTSQLGGIPWSFLDQKELLTDADSLKVPFTDTELTHEAKALEPREIAKQIISFNEVQLLNISEHALSGTYCAGSTGDVWSEEHN